MYPLRIRPSVSKEEENVTLKLEQDEAHLIAEVSETSPVEEFEDVVQYQIQPTKESFEAFQWVGRARNI